MSKNKYIDYINDIPVKEAKEALKYANAPKKKRERLTPKKENKYNKLLDLEAIRAEKMARSYKEFVKGAWHTVEPKGVFLDNWHIDAICETVQAVIDGEILNVIINIPPRSSKTRLVSDLLVPWVWIKNPWMRFLYASYAEDLSIISSRYCKGTLLSKWYQDRWGDKYKLVAAKDKDLTNDIAGYRRIKSVAAGVTGQGGHVIVADDPLKAQDAFSTQMREGCNSWYDNAFSNRIEGGIIAEGKRIVMMQRLHDNDLTGYILSKNDVYDWYHLCLPMEYNPDKKSIIQVGDHVIAKDPREKKGELLHPLRFDEKAVAAEKGKGSFYFSSQYQQDPVPEGGGIIKADWLTKNYYHEDPDYWYNNSTRVIQSWDLTFSDKKDADYVVGQVWAQAKQDFYLIDQVRARMNFPDTMAAILSLKATYPRTQEIVIEEKANGQGMIDMLKNMIRGIYPYNPEMKSKDERLALVSWMVETGHVHFPDPEKNPQKFNWVLDAILEITRFPAAKHDDIVDAFSQALQRMHTSMIILDASPTGVPQASKFSKNWQGNRVETIISTGIDRPWNRNWGA